MNKPKSSSRLLIGRLLTLSVSCAAVLAFTTTAQAQTVYFDVNGSSTTPPFGDPMGGTYNWTVDPVWSTSAAGSAATTTYATASGGSPQDVVIDVSGDTSGNSVTMDLQSNLTITSLTAQGGGQNLLVTSTNGSILTSMGFVANSGLNLNNITIAPGDFAVTGGNLVFMTGSTSYNGTANIGDGSFNRLYLLTGGSANESVNLVSGGVLQTNYGATLGNLSGTGGSVTEAFGAGYGGGGLVVNSTKDTTFAGGINLDTANGGGVAQFTKQGANSLTLSGANAEIGQSTIAAGKLVAANNDVFSAQSTGVEVKNGATLQVNNGIVLNSASNVTLDGPTAVFDVGTTNVVGTAELAGNLTASLGATLKFDLNGTGASAIDLLKVDGTLSLNGPVTFEFTNLLDSSDIHLGHKYQIVDGTVVLGANFDPNVTIIDPNGLYDGHIIQDAGGLEVQFAPEPSTWAFLSIGLALVAVMRLRVRTSRVA